MKAKSSCNVLTLSTTFPNPAQPALGLFVRARALALNKKKPLNVIAPVSVFRGLTLSRDILATPLKGSDESINVFHPRWVNIPGGYPINAILLALSILFLLVRLRNRVKVDIIDAHFGYIDGVAACLVAAVLGKPFLVTLRGSEVTHAHYRWRRLAMSWALRRASRVIVVSSNLYQLALDLGVCSEAVAEIPNGVDTQVFRPRSGGRVSGRISGPRNDSKIVASIGNLINLKGHHRVIAAISRLVAQGRDIELLIAGSEDIRELAYSERLRTLAKMLQLEDRVHFLGGLSPEAVADVMRSADVLCLASSREGCPNVVREALACGTPVVATAVGAVPKLVPHERFGFVVPKDDDLALEQALALALSKSWDRHVIARWGASRDWEEVADDIVRQLDLALARV